MFSQISLFIFLYSQIDCTESEKIVLCRCSYMRHIFQALVRRHAERVVSDQSTISLFLHKPGFSQMTSLTRYCGSGRINGLKSDGELRCSKTKFYYIFIFVLLVISLKENELQNFMTLNSDIFVWRKGRLSKKIMNKKHIGLQARCCVLFHNDLSFRCVTCTIQENHDCLNNE